MRTEDFLNFVEERETEELVDEETIIQLIQDCENRDEGEDNEGDEEGNEEEMNCQLFLLRKD